MAAMVMTSSTSQMKARAWPDWHLNLFKKLLKAIHRIIMKCADNRVRG